MTQLPVNWYHKLYRGYDYFVVVRIARRMRSSGANNFVLLALLAVGLIAAVKADTTFLKTWSLYHSLDGGKDFVRRGQIRMGAVAVDSDNLSTEGALELTIEQDDDENLTMESIQQLIGIRLYQLKLVEDGNEASVVLTSVPACHLRRANFRCVD